jgi:hypothetical protein
MDKVARVLVPDRRRCARTAKDFPLGHALFALATFVAVCGKVLAETPDTKLDFLPPHDVQSRVSVRGAPRSTGAARSSGFFVIRRRFRWRSRLASPDILPDQSRLARNAR